MRLNPEMLRVLSGLEVQGNQVKIVEKLDRRLYLQVNTVLEAFGGKWNRKAKAHVFERRDPADLLECVLSAGSGEISITLPKELGFFPTPQDLASRIVALADVQNRHWVLEPSAGKGALIEAVKSAAPSARVEAYELLAKNVDDLVDSLIEKLSRCVKPSPTLLPTLGIRVNYADFLEVPIRAEFDRVVMNPPFAKRADIAHVRRAYQWLKEGGRLVSVMSAGVAWREDRLAKEFRQFVQERSGTIQQLPEGSFHTSGTEVNTVVVCIDR